MTYPEHENQRDAAKEDFYKRHEAQPPAHLSAKSKELWGHVVPASVRCPERLALLQTGLEALDRADQAREAIAREGLTTVTARSGVVHVNPLTKIEKDARTQFLQVWTALDFHKMDFQPPR